MREIILIKNGELALKGLNRVTFEDILIKNLRRSIKHIGEADIRKAQSTIYIEPKSENFDFDAACERVSKVFGLAAFSRAFECEKDIEVIKNTAVQCLKDQLCAVSTFKIEAKRSDKKFSLNSPQICMELGGYLLSQFSNLSVDVHNPDLVVTVEVRDYAAYVRGKQLPGAGGMPVGSGGRVTTLISGGIDSPVATWMMAKRGLIIDAVHFASPPYTSLRAEQKVTALLSKVAKYSGTIRVEIVNFTEIQEEIGKKCPEDYFTLIMRRFMMKISEILAKRRDSMALVTGESVGQVASQTLAALAVTDMMVDMPVFRPVIGMDKEEIIAISRKIDTFETSTLPFEDCCTVFTPKHPKTRPVAEKVAEAESDLDIDGLIERAVANVRTIYID